MTTDQEKDMILLNTKFGKALVSTIISRFLRSKGIDINVSLMKFNLERSEKGWDVNVSATADGTITDELVNNIMNS